MGFQIRDARDDDAWDLIGLVAGCWSEYPGCILDVHGEEPELLSIATAFRERGGRFWVAEDAGRLVGSVGMAPAPKPAATLLLKLYVARSARRQGLGGTLLKLVESEAAAIGSTAIEIWTDTRFIDAHRLYDLHGYVRNGATRELHDLSHSVEYHYLKALNDG
jgi:putative acetyltransferase